MIIGDLETDGLLDTVTKIHCASFYNTKTQDWTIFTPDNINKLPSFLDSCPTLAFHNGLSFDLPVLKKLYSYEYKGEYTDTLALSRILCPDIEIPTGITKGAGSHSVEAWGIRFNIAKPKHEDWSKFSEEMLHRNKEDVKIQVKIYQHCMRILTDRKINLVDFRRTLDVEQRVWEIIDEQEQNGWQFDVPYAEKLVEELTDVINPLEEELINILPMILVKPYKDGVCKAFKQNGELTSHAANWVKDRFEEVGGDFCRVQFKNMHPGQDGLVKDYMLSLGWVPDEYNFKKDRFNKPVKDEYGKRIKTSPKMPKGVEAWEKVARAINTPSITLLAEYNKATHRRSQIKGLIEAARGDGRVPAGANTLGTPTARCVHRCVVNIPKAKDEVFYGKKMRSMFIAAPGKVLVGADASALEARCEAHYIWDLDRANALELIQGDIHSRNAAIFGTNRDIAKNGKYAIGYGCSATKLAATIGCTIGQAKMILDAYWEQNIGLKRLKEQLELEWQQKGFILAIDGRPLSIRYKHALINTLFQSCGAIIMKYALVILDKSLKCAKIVGWKFVGNFHDEFAIECNPEDAERIGKMAVESMEKAGRLLKINVPITGEYMVGSSWAATH